MLTRKNDSCKSISRLSVAAAVIAALLLGGCAGNRVESQSFQVSKTSSIDSAQIAVDADFGRYSNLLATELGIFFPQTHRTTADDLQRIRQIFREAFLAELENYAIVTEPGPSTMAVEASLIDMRNSSSQQIPNIRSNVRDLATPGSILFLMEMRDSQTNRVLARAADSAQAPTFSTAEGVETDWASIEDAALNWATLFRTFLDENFAH
ncbi:MAG: DUF3313 family protein [Woeseiaceae bacterium]